MGSATAQALAASTQTLAAAKDVTLETARELFAAARAVGESSQLSGALADPSAPTTARQNVVSAVFGQYGSAAQDVLRTAVAVRWSNASELIDGLEELAIRAATIAEPGADIEGELFGFSRVIAANPELELALGSRLGGEDAKAALVERLLADASASAPTALIVPSLVRQPRERRVRQLLSRAMRIVSSQRPPRGHGAHGDRSQRRPAHATRPDALAAIRRPGVPQRRHRPQRRRRPARADRR